MPTYAQTKASDLIALTAGLMKLQMPERAKGIQPELDAVTAIGAQTLAAIAQASDDPNLSPQGRREAIKKVLLDAAPKVKQFRDRAAKATVAVEDARRAAIAVPPQKPDADRYHTDEFVMAQLAKMHPKVVAQRYAEGLAGDARFHTVVRAVRLARELGVPILEEVIQDVYDSHALENSPMKDQVDAQEETAGFLAGLTGTVDSALRDVAKDSGLESEYMGPVEVK
jgi:hypothetical protein